MNTSHSLRPADFGLSRSGRRLGLEAAIGIIVGAAMVAGCSSPSEPQATGSVPPATTRPALTTVTVPATTLGTDGTRIYATKCAGCHGTSGEGNLGPSLIGIADRLTVTEQIAVVANGRGTMLAFSPALTADQISAVVDYTRTELP